MSCSCNHTTNKEIVFSYQLSDYDNYWIDNKTNYWKIYRLPNGRFLVDIPDYYLYDRKTITVESYPKALLIVVRSMVGALNRLKNISDDNARYVNRAIDEHCLACLLGAEFDYDYFKASLKERGVNNPDLLDDAKNHYKANKDFIRLRKTIQLLIEDLLLKI